uniref:Uncharacterized protein n=1 Tax=Lepeophtheirus salmonis TaxID=72036 RepID=A0A0K2UQ51_LEPSM
MALLRKNVNWNPRRCFHGPFQAYEESWSTNFINQGLVGFSLICTLLLAVCTHASS